MAGIRVRRLLRLINGSRPFQPISDGQLPLRNLEAAYQDICSLAERYPLDLTSDIIFAFCVNACCYDELGKASRVFRLFDEIGHHSVRTEAYGLLFGAFLNISESRLSSSKGMVQVDQHVEAVNLVERALRTAHQDPQSIDVGQFIQHAIKALLVILRPFIRPLWAQHFSNTLERIMPLIGLPHGSLPKGSEKVLKSSKPAPSSQSYQGWKPANDNNDDTDLKLLTLFLVYASFCFEDGGKRPKAQKAVEDATQLWSELKASHGHTTHWERWLCLLERKLAMIRGWMGAKFEVNWQTVTKLEAPHWMVATEVAINRICVRPLQRDQAAAKKGDGVGGELMKAWALLDPTLAQLVENASIERGTSTQVDAQLQPLNNSTNNSRKYNENEHFAAYLLTKAALAQRLLLLARTMAKSLIRWRTGSSGALLLQGILDVETDLYLQEFLHAIQLKESTSFAPSTRLSMLTPCDVMPCPVPEWRLSAIRRLDESLVAVEHLNEKGDLVEICVATMWNIALPCLCRTFRRSVCRSLQKASNALERCQSSQISLRVVLLHQLAQWELEEERLAGAQTTIEKALALDCLCRPETPGKSEHLPNGVSSTTIANPVLAASCALEPDGIAYETGDRASHPLSCCLERMWQQNLSLTAKNCTWIDQIQQLAFRSKHEKMIARLCEDAEKLSRHVFKRLKEEELRQAIRPQRVQRAGIANKAQANAQALRLSLNKENSLLYTTDLQVKKIISAFSCFMKRALELEDSKTVARAATVILSLVHGTEDCLDAEALTINPLGSPQSVDLRVRLRPPSEVEVAVDVIHAAYALAVCKYTERAAGPYEKAEGYSGIVDANRFLSLPEEGSALPKDAEPGSHCADPRRRACDMQRLLLLYGGQLSAAFGQEWLLYNCAIHARNIFNILVEESPPRTTEIQQLMPFLKEIFQRLMEQPSTTYEVVLEAFTEFCCRAALAIQDFASFQDFCDKALPLWHNSSRRALFGALLQDVMQKNLSQPVLSRVLKPATDARGTTEKSGKIQKQRGQTGALTDNYSLEKMSPDILILLQLERTILEKETSTKEQLLLQCAELLRSASATRRGNGAAALEEPAEMLKSELWARLAAAALSLSPNTFQHFAVAFAFEALGSTHCRPPYKVVSNNAPQQLWRGVAHVLVGLALTATDITRSGRLSAVRHLYQACMYGKEAGCFKLLLFAAKALWNAALPVITDGADATEACAAVKAVISAIPACGRSILAGSAIRLCMGLLWSFRDSGRWEELLSTAEGALVLAPKVIHAVLAKMQILALTHKAPDDLTQSVRSIARGESSSEASLLLFFARLSREKSAASPEAYGDALNLLQEDGDPQAITVHLEIAEELLSMRRPWIKALVHIRTALDLAKAMKDPKEFPGLACHSEHKSGARNDSGAGATDAEDSVTVRRIGLRDLLLLHAQTLRLLHSPDSADAAEAAREIVVLSSGLIEDIKAKNLEPEDEAEALKLDTALSSDKPDCPDRYEERRSLIDPWAAASLCKPIRFKLPSLIDATPATNSNAGRCEHSTNGVSEGSDFLRAADVGHSQEQIAGIRNSLLWSTSLSLAFRSLCMAESCFFELGLEFWALRLIRLRAKVIEAYLSLSFKSRGSASRISSSGCMHPAVGLLQASLNMSVFRAALACDCLKEARNLLPLFAPDLLRTWVSELDSRIQGDEGYSNSFGRQARSLSVLTLHLVSCIIPLSDLLVTLGEQCLVTGELGVASLLGCAASRYMPPPGRCSGRALSLHARHVALLAATRLRQGDPDGALRLVHKALESSELVELEIPAAYELVKICWDVHAEKGTQSAATPLVEKMGNLLCELATTSATTYGSDRTTHIPMRSYALSSKPQNLKGYAIYRKDISGKASAFCTQGHPSRTARGPVTAEVIQLPLILAVWRHRLKSLKAEHLFSLHCLGWVTEGGTLQKQWKKAFLEAMELLSSLLDRSDEVRVLLKPLRACAIACMRGVRFLTAAMRFLWACPGNFSAYCWGNRNGPPTVRHESSDAHLVGPHDLEECMEKLHRLLADLDLESKAILDFVAAVNGNRDAHQSALAWNDMIAVASAQVACLRHQLLLTTMEFWRADIQKILGGTFREAAGDDFSVKAFNHGAICCRGERLRFLQEWLYKSHKEDVCLPENMESEQRRLEYAVQALANVRTVSLCRRQAGRGPPSRVLDGNSLLLLQWTCQFALLQQYQHFMHAKRRVHEQGRDLDELCPWTNDEHESRECKYMWIEDLRSALSSVSKSGKGLQKSCNQIVFAGQRDPAAGNFPSIASHEIENAFQTCIASGCFNEAIALGEELISGVLGNKNSEHLERLFGAICLLQAAQVAQNARLLHFKNMNRQRLESVIMQELRYLEESHQHARILPQAKALETTLESNSCFTRMTEISDLSPSAVIHSWLPRNVCVACVHCSRGFVFLAVAYPTQQAEGLLGTFRYFVQRRALPACLLLDLCKGTEVNGNTREQQGTTAAPCTYAVQVHGVLEDLFDLMALQMLQWSLEAMVSQSPPTGVSEPRRHLLLLPDLRLSHFPFEGLKAVQKLFGFHVTRDLSLHMFARRMQQNEPCPPFQPKRTVADMHTGFTRDSLLLLPQTSESLAPSIAIGHDYVVQEELAHQIQPNIRLQETSQHTQASSRVLPKTPTSPPQTPKERFGSDWRCLVLAELAAVKKCGDVEGEPELHPDNTAFPELLCSKYPQVVWALSLNKMMLLEDLNVPLDAMDLAHLSLIGLLSMRSPDGSSQNIRRKRAGGGCFQHQQVALPSEAVETVLMLSTRAGVRTIAAVDAFLTDQQNTELAVRFLKELVGFQAPVCSAVEALLTSGGQERQSHAMSKRHASRKSEHEDRSQKLAGKQPVQENLTVLSSEVSNTGLDAKGAQDLAGTVRIYGLPWIARLGSQKLAAKPEMQKEPPKTRRQ
ncbi:hypothetical protein Efla_004849 [Eimeria flavescens]